MSIVRVMELLSPWRGRPRRDVPIEIIALDFLWREYCRRVNEDDVVLRENELVWRAGLSLAGKVSHEHDQLTVGFDTIRDTGHFLLKLAHQRGVA